MVIDKKTNRTLPDNITIQDYRPLGIDKVKFKSNPVNYALESLDLKNNTVREVDVTDDRFKLLHAWPKGTTKYIEIENAETGESFTRYIRDVTFWADTVIITWAERCL